MPTSGSRTFVLLHGSWHGGWCWDRLVPLLEQQRHRVLAPTLLGLGELADRASPELGLSAHIDQIESLLIGEDLDAVTLVGHSYGGMLLTALADRVPDRISWLVYLDAFLPEHGQSCFDLMPDAEADFQVAADAGGRGWLVPPMSAEDLGVSDPTLARWVEARLTPMPIRTHQEALDAPLGRARTRRRAFILCEQFGFHAFAAQARDEAFDVVRSIDSGHDVQLTHPHQLAEILFQLP
jgi:pimeloyl-ACP methyl ester carboxylesterase